MGEPNTPATSSDFERQKWQDEVRLREREIAIKEREQELKARELQRSRWFSPLVLAVFAAAVGVFGNALVAYINGGTQTSLEEAKAEAARILEMIKTADPDSAAVNLSFLLQTGLISNYERQESLRQYLASRSKGQGPALPTAEPCAITINPVKGQEAASLDILKVVCR